MKILAIDTTSENLVIAYYDGEKTYSFVSDEGSKRHNSILMPSVDKVLSKSGDKISDVDCFACVVGPGSFTGIRIGVSTVKALAFATGKKCVSVTSFEELAYGNTDKEFYVAIDCRHDSYYYAKFNGGYRDQAECGEILSEDLDKLDCPVIKKQGASDPDNLIAIAKEKFLENDFSNPVPFYLKKSQAEREYEKMNMDKTV